MRPDTPPQGSPVPEYVQKRWKDPDDPLKKRAAALGLKMVPRQIIPSTRRAHELRGAAVEAGLDPDELQKAIEEGRYRPAVEEALREAQETGIHAVPTFLFDGQLAIQGAQEYPIFKLAMDRLGAKPRQ